MTSFIYPVLVLYMFGAAVFAQTSAEVETVQLVIQAPPDILISRLNPPVLELNSPFGGAVTTAKINGELWQENPEFYYTSLRPVTWKLTVPADTEPGSYRAPFRTTFSLCSKTRGFCFTEVQDAVFTLQVGTREENPAVVLTLTQPE